MAQWQKCSSADLFIPDKNSDVIIPIVTTLMLSLC
jgi:hypothetical protein